MRLLVVVDMQNDFITGSLGTKEAQAIVGRVAKKIRDFNGAIAVTQDTHQENYLETQEGKNLPVEHCIEDTPGWALDDEIFDAIDDRSYSGCPVEWFTKNTFGSTALGSWLTMIAACKDGIDEVVLVGLCTDICVISNALLVKAFLPNVKVTVDASCCAGVTQESHANALAAMKMCQINVENLEG